MINIDTYNEMKRLYGFLSSWAIWADETDKPKSNIGDLGIFDNPKINEILNPEIIFIGLNISRNGTQLPWGNFHDSGPNGQDYKIRYALSKTPWWGGYMTDVIKSHEEVNSSNLMRYLKNNPDYEKINVLTFLEEIKNLGSKKPKLIAVGNDSFNILKRNLKDDFDIIKIPHYAKHVNRVNYRNEVLSIGGFATDI